MAESKPRQKVRGVYEHPKGSEIWWIQYFEQGRRRRERVGTHAHAVKLYQKRRTQILIGDKLPELQRKRVTFGELLDDAIVFAREHNRSARDAVGKAELLRPSFGTRFADDLKPDEFAAWIRHRDVGPATFNRYRAFVSLCFREGIRAGKVKQNPARQLKQKREPGGRKEFLSRADYELVLTRMREHCPERVPEFVVSVQTGMRLSEQFRLTWRHVDMDQRVIDLRWTKNGDDRKVPMTSEVFAMLQAIRPRKPLPGAAVFPRPRNGKRAPQPRWFPALLRREDVGILEYTWHNNRHTFCSWLAMAGVPLRTIQELAGHKTIAMTSRYSHLSPDHKGAEIEKLVTAGKPRLLAFPGATGTANR